MAIRGLIDVVTGLEIPDADARYSLTGIQGVTGISGGGTGLQGITGIQGTTGVQGESGLLGLTGIQGTQGNTGLIGSTGIQGIQGNTGLTGYTGIQGIQGNTGLIGSTGIQGTQGTTGIQGVTGISGGGTGLQGVTGIQGNQGTTGVQGIQGTTGIQGTQGNQGTTGVQGSSGLQGITGLRGTTGVQGIQGTTGVQGTQGTQGTTGVQGLTGAEGAYRFLADQLDSPNNSNWAVNALAPASADSSNNALTVRRFDDTTEEGVGFMVNLPDSKTNIIFGFKSRAQTAPAGTVNVQPKVYTRKIPDNAIVTSWSGAYNMTALSIPANTFFHYDTETLAYTALDLTGGRLTQFEITRNPSATNDLTGDWCLLELSVSFS